MNDDDDMLYREMNEEDPFYMGPSCDDERWQRDRYGRILKDRNGNPIAK